MKKIMGSSIKFKKVMVSILLCLMMVSMVSTPVSASVDSWNTFRNTMGGRSGDYEGWLERTIESSHATLWDEYDNGGVRLDNYQTWLEKHDAVKAAYQSWMEETYVGADHAFLDGKYNEYINGMYAGGAIWVPSYYDWLDGLGRDSYTAAYQEYINGGPSVPDSGGLFTGRIDLGIDWGTLIFGGLSYKDTVIK
ncbi:MAG: hypothetical protein LBL34_07085, partial [Clostridiales bacterium]|nr:hypothetical protein [Clostridiales bacterium]